MANTAPPLPLLTTHPHPALAACLPPEPELQVVLGAVGLVPLSETDPQLVRLPLVPQQVQQCGNQAHLQGWGAALT